MLMDMLIIEAKDFKSEVTRFVLQDLGLHVFRTIALMLFMCFNNGALAENNMRNGQLVYFDKTKRVYVF